MGSCIAWDERAQIIVDIPAHAPRRYDGGLALCIAFAMDLDACYPEHASIILSESLGMVTMPDVRLIRARPDFPRIVRLDGASATLH